ncbi:class I SAM-dependent DNA methyltransferase [Flavobacterium sp.]|jgi:type I restriction-modification system DNA methylase subunit|uniref:class I SAM-dependent DNA methyltransferase n=1 Tax=Flavobacterium sp. TaxID=239 RepID=UPI0037C11A99
MSGQSVIESIGLNRAISTHSVNEKLTESQRHVLTLAKKFNVDSVYFNTDQEGNSFPATFLKKVQSFDFETLKEIAEIQKDIWNYKKVLFLYVYCETEIRIYSCSEKPLIVTQTEFNYEKELQKIEIQKYQFSDKEHLEELNHLFSSIAIDSGVIWTLKEAQFIRDKINIQRRVDKYLVESLVNTTRQLEQQGLEINFIHKIILRSLFLLYLEDRGATDEKFYSQIKDSAKSYFDILEDVEATYSLYNRLEGHFNGNVFSINENEIISLEQLQLIKKCFISGNDNTPQIQLFEDWRLFDFSIIQIELLSEIYENFLFKTDPELKKKTGTYYTPPPLVEFILNEKLPVNGQGNFNVKVLDPSCGSGIFLVESFKRLVKRYENHHQEKLTDFEKLKTLLTENIFGIEIHPQAIKVAAFSLYLALVDHLNPKTIWQEKNSHLPNLINDPEDSTLKTQGSNLFRRDSIQKNEEIEKIKFDLVVGNPPFGTKGLLESVSKYCDENKFAKEMVLPFLHKAVKFAPNGKIALIFNTKVLTNTGGTYQNFRRWLFNDCYVEKVFNFSILRNVPKNFGGQLFGDATGPISIVYYQKEKPEELSDKIMYYAPKTFIKTNVVEGLSIDFTDLKYLPREECQNPKTKIWKVSMWGGMNDWELIKKINKKQSSFKTYLVKNNIDYGSGLHPKENEHNKLLIEGRHTDTDKIEKYYTPIEKTTEINKEYRKNNLKLFRHPLAILKEGITNKNILSSYFDYDVYYNKAVYGFSTHETEKLKSIVITFNSNLVTYFFFLTSSSWAIERDRIVLTEYLDFPYSELDGKDLEKIQFSDVCFDRKISLLNQHKNCFDFQYWELKINKLYNLSQNDIIRVSDTITLSVDLFHKKEKSIALYPVKQEQVTAYAIILSNELNNFLDGQQLFANVTVYNSIGVFTPLMMIKISHDISIRDIVLSDEQVDIELKKLDKYLWEKKATNIYFRKKLNYKKNNDIYIIRPNQRRFWSQSIAVEDASDLILEILNEEHDEA